MNKTLTICISIGVVLVGLSFLINANTTNQRFKAEEKRLDQERADAIEAQRKKDSSRSFCIALAAETYNKDWEAECKVRRLGENCSLPLYLADRLNDRLKTQKETCYKNYPTQ